MTLRMCVLGSGSRGNCIYVASPEAAILIDAGLSAKQTRARLAMIGVDLNDIDAVCISHEHSDHVSGLRVICKQTDARVYANAGTAQALAQTSAGLNIQWNIFSTGTPFSISDMEILPFSLSHDAYEPVGYVISRASMRIGIATDLGMMTTLARQRLSDCEVLVIEANHDVHLVERSNRPWSLKQRILGRQGHLSNDSAAEAIIDCAGKRLTRVYLAHMSDECNDCGLAKQLIGKALASADLKHIEVCETYPDRISDCWEAP